MNEDNLSLNNTGNVADVQQNPLDREVTGIPQDVTNGVEDTNMPPQQMAPQYNPLSDPQRVEYWQSRSDRVLQENQELQKYKEVVDYIQNNDQLRSAVSGALEGGGKQVEVSLSSRPVEPQGYNEYDSFNSPESSSFQYRQQMDKWRDSVIDYAVNQEVRKVEENKYQQQVKSNIMEARKQLMGVAQNLKTQYGYNDNEIRDFILTMGNNKSITFDNLVKYHRFTRGNGNNNTVNQMPSIPLGGGGMRSSQSSNNASSNFNSFLKMK